MRRSFLRSTVRVALLVPFAALLCIPVPGLAGTLGSAQSFAVLGYAGVTNTGPTQIYGNVGVSPLPLTSITGFPPGTVTGGSIFGPSSIADLALADINKAAITLDGLQVTSDLSNQDLGNRTLTPGVYFSSDVTALLNGTLTLDALGNPNAQFVFQLAHALTTGSGSVVNVINGDASTEIYWVLGSSAALGSSSTFAGNILAGSSIALDSTAAIECGGAFARTESVTLIDNVISGNCSAQSGGGGGGTGGGGGGGSNGGGGGSNGGGGGDTTIIPEPATLTLLSMGLGAGFLSLLLQRFRPRFR